MKNSKPPPDVGKCAEIMPQHPDAKNSIYAVLDQIETCCLNLKIENMRCSASLYAAREILDWIALLRHQLQFSSKPMLQSIGTAINGLFQEDPCLSTIIIQLHHSKRKPNPNPGCLK